jgi:hypothetical protein
MPTDTPPLANPGQFSMQLAPDHAVVVGSGAGLTRLYAASYADVFQENAGRVADLQPGFAPATLVSILDTSPTDLPGVRSVGRNPHGDFLAGVNRILSCGTNGVCAGRYRHRLTMDLYNDPAVGIVEDRVGGGDFGTLVGLAQSIYAEVAYWRMNVPNQNLVLNLSLGWNPAYGGEGDDPTLWPPDVQAVYEAILHARCQGAVVVAAAGNRSGGPFTDAEGPMYPGGWEGLRDMPARCSEHYGGNPPPVVPPTNAPMVVAASGVDEDNRDLANARPGARSRLLAYGAHATVADTTSPQGYTTPITGSSVSAAVVSAAVAVVWDNLPGLTAEEVQNLVADSGVAVGRPARLCPGGAAACGPSVRVGVCQALRHACDVHPGTAGTCRMVSGPVTCASATSAPASPALGRALWDARSPDVDLGAYPSVSLGRFCDGETVHNTPFPWVGEPCPHLTRYALEEILPSTEPQPHDTACPVCLLVASSGEVVLEQDRPFDSVTSLTIHLEDASGTKTNYTTRDIPTGERVTFKLDPSLTATAVSASVTAVTAETTYLSVLDVLP